MDPKTPLPFRHPSPKARGSFHWPFAAPSGPNPGGVEVKKFRKRENRKRGHPDACAWPGFDDGVGGMPKDIIAWASQNGPSS